MKKLLVLVLFSTVVIAHPVSYTIELQVSYDEIKKEAEVICESNSKNKCGLHNIKLLNKDGNIMKIKRFPFLKKSIKIKTDTKPSKLEFFLRKVPEHKYIKIF